ncbi:MAG: hypothetical protein GX779_01795 [Clostridia bacterium]|jgi:hypothetical protein|nr:hypothetical protein [Clostridia bacterium]
MLFRSPGKLNRKGTVGQSKITHQFFPSPAHWQQSPLNKISRQDFTFNMDGEDLGRFPPK